MPTLRLGDDALSGRIKLVSMTARAGDGALRDNGATAFTDLVVTGLLQDLRRLSRAIIGCGVGLSHE